MYVVICAVQVCEVYLLQSTVLWHVPALHHFVLCTHTSLHPQLMHGQSPMRLLQNS